VTDRLPAGQADVKLSQVDAHMSPIEAERTARFLTKSCNRDTLATMLGEKLAERDRMLRELQDAETRVFVVTRALELHPHK
jgi:hypothetical protein